MIRRIKKNVRGTFGTTKFRVRYALCRRLADGSFFLEIRRNRVKLFGIRVGICLLSRVYYRDRLMKMKRGYRMM